MGWWLWWRLRGPDSDWIGLLTWVTEPGAGAGDGARGGGRPRPRRGRSRIGPMTSQPLRRLIPPRPAPSTLATEACWEKSALNASVRSQSCSRVGSFEPFPPGVTRPVKAVAGAAPRLELARGLRGGSEALRGLTQPPRQLALHGKYGGPGCRARGAGGWRWGFPRKSVVWWPRVGLTRAEASV